MLRRILKDQVILEADDHRILNYKRTDATKFLKAGNPIKPADLKVGDLIEVESTQDEEGFLTAVNVMWQQDGSEKDREHAAEPVEVSIAKGSHDKETDSKESEVKEPDAKQPDAERPDGKQLDGKQPEKPVTKPPAPADSPADDPNPADLNAPSKDKVKAVQIDSEDQGPPVLKRGGKTVHRDAAHAPEAVQSAKNEEPSEPDARTTPTTSAVQRPEEVVIEKAREAAGSFLETLPNYYCQEVMTRYQTESGSNWRPLDVISMALVYENGQESYRNLQVGGKPTKKKIEDLSGAWSTGEFGTVLADVFSPSTAADFEYRKQSRSGGRAALVYDFSVEREHSHWRIMVASQLLMPSYKGSIWIDKDTNRVLRIEMQATHIPEAFPTDKVEMATDYEFVRFGEQQFLVPTHAETLGCQRDTGACNRNAIDFRNYHKFTGESSITFDK